MTLLLMHTARKKNGGELNNLKTEEKQIHKIKKKGN